MKLQPNHELNASARPCPAAPPESPAASSPPDTFISKHELAARLKKTVRTIENWQRRGILPYVKCSHSVLFKWADVEAHLQNHFRVCSSPPHETKPAPAGKRPRRRNRKDNACTS